MLAQLAAGERVTADAAARAKFDTMGNPTGDLKDPTITLHTVADPLVLVQNEKVFQERVLLRQGPDRRRRPALHDAAGHLPRETPVRPTVPATATSPPRSGSA